MEYGAKSSAEKPSSELEKRGSRALYRFPEVGSESSGPNALRGEEVSDMKVEALTACVIPPPPLFQLRTCAGTLRVLTSAFLFVLTLAVGVLFLSLQSFAQEVQTWKRPGDGRANNWSTLTTKLLPVTGTQTVRLRNNTFGQYRAHAIYACAWVSLEPPHATNAPSSGCTKIYNAITAGSNTFEVNHSVSITQAMINNGKVVLVARYEYSPMVNMWAVGIPLVPRAIIVSQSTAIGLTEGSTSTYTVKLEAQPADDVTIRVASNNAGVAVKAGSNPAGARQDITFNSTTWNTPQTVTVEALSDDNLLDERAILSHEVLSGSAPEYSGAAGRVNVNVMDDDYPGLMITGASASESDETLDFTVKLSAASSRRVAVDWTVIAAGPDAGTATPGTAGSGDYDHSSARSGTLVFYEGSPLTRTIPVPINDDSVLEGDETVKVSLGTPSPGDVRVSGSGVATGTIVDDDERTVVGVTSGEFSQGDTKVTVDSRLPEDTGLEVVLPTELESGGEAIEELTVTLGPSDVEIDADLFGYTGDAADHMLVDVDVSPVPDAAVRICLPVTEGLRMEAGERRLYLIRFSGGTWEELSSTVEGEMVCADTSGFSPFAVVYERMTNMGSGSGSSGSGGDGGCAISGENRFASPTAWFSSPMFLVLLPLLFFGRFRKRCRRFPHGE